VVVAAAVGVTAAPASAANPWLDRRVLNMTHQGGENEFPSNTMYAYRESLALGADMIELDVQPTKDGRLVALHDATVARTTGAPGSTYDMTLEQVQALDAAHNFVPGRGTVNGLEPSAYPLRGVRTGAKTPPLGYAPEDFRIPALEEVLRAFPRVPVNIEIKGRSDSDTASFLRNADLLVALLRRVAHRDLIVVSFNQDAVDRFHAQMPEIGVAPGIVGVTTFVVAGLAPAGTVALQVPPAFSGVPVMTPDFVSRAHRAGHAVHVWFSGQEESERVYNTMLDMGTDGLMPAKPAALERVLCARRVSRPPGNPNHCGGGDEAAAGGCAARVLSVSPLGAGGRVGLALARGEQTGYACAGTVRLRAGRASLGSGRFRFPYGARHTIGTATLGPHTRARLRRAPRRLAAVAAARVNGQARDRARRVTLRKR